jgi:hypothetical protein
MKNSKKKSPAKSKKTITKNPLKKYIGGGPALGSSGFTPTYSSGPTIGSFYGNTTGFTPTTGNTFGGGTTFGSNNTFGSGTLGNNNYGFNTGSATGNNNYGFTPVDFNQVNADLGFNPSNSAYSGADRTLDSTITPEFDGKQAAQEKIKEMGYGEYIDKKPVQTSNKPNQTLDAVGAAMPGVGLVTNLVKDSSIKDASGYYDKKTKAKLEQYNKKINASAAASSVGQGLLATSAAWGPLAWIPAAAGGIIVGASEGAKASYQSKQGNLGEDYDTRVANRIKYKESQAERRQEGLDRNAATNYYSQGSGLAKYGGMREYQMGGVKRLAGLESLNFDGPIIQNREGLPSSQEIQPERMFHRKPIRMDKTGLRPHDGYGNKRYYQTSGSTTAPSYENGGGYQKVTGPSHENGGIDMDLSGDGVNDAELEGGEIIEEMKHGGNAPKKYIWSDHLKTGGMSFAKKFEELRKGGARPGDVETLRIEQELAAKRDPSKLYAKYGGMMNYQKGGLRKVPEIEPIGRDLSAKNAIKRLYYGAIDPKGESNVTHQLARLMPPTLIANTVGEGVNSVAQQYYKFTGNKEQLKKEADRQAIIEDQNKQLENYKKTLESEGLSPLFKQGGMHKYQTGGNKKEVLSSDISKVLQNDTLNPDFIRRPLSIDESKVWQDDDLSPDFINKEKQAKVYKENSIPKKKNGGLMKYQGGGVPPVPPTPSDRVSRTGAGKFFAEYGAPMASLAGGIGDIAMNLSQKYNPVETVNARELTADKIYIDRAKDKQAGFRESELMGAKRASRATTGTGATQRENALRMTSLRAGEEAAQNIYNQNRQASTDEQKINLDAQMRVDEANRQTDIVESESRRNEGLRKESFENMRKKYIGSVVGELGNELASGMYRKEYINATLPDGVDPYELRAGAIADMQQKINPATGELYTLADANNAVLMQLEKERQDKAAKKAARKKGP